MLLATRCPFCETVFRIQPTQLAVRRGLVRCGHCQEAFDASGSLYEVAEGGDFAHAAPVTAEVAASLTAPLDPHSALHPALDAALNGASHADTETFAPEQPVTPPVSPTVTEAVDEPIVQREVEPGIAAASAPASSPTASPVSSPVAQPEAAPPKPAAALNFSNRAWDPWAPPSESHIDPRLQYNADHLPQAGIAPSATPGLTRGVESRVIVDDGEPTLTREELPREAVAAEVAHDAPAYEAAPREHVVPEAVVPAAPAPAAAAPEASAQPVETPAPAARAAAPAAQASQTAQAAQAFHAAQAAPAPQPAPAVQPAQPVEPFPPATRWTRVEPGLTASAPVEPTLAGHETSRPRIDDPEPTLVNRAYEPAREPVSEPPRELPRNAGWQAAPETAAPAFSALEPNEGQPFAVTREAPARARAGRRAGWRVLGAIVALLLFALLVVQIAWWQRETVMVYWPNSQPLYLKACAQLGCRVLPPRDIDGLLVEPSDLRQVDNEPHHLELKVPLRNRFNVALAYPAIELSLLDRQNNIVVRRVLWPQDYVTPGTRVEAGLPAHTTQTMIVRLDTGDVVASNFRIEIFYP